MKNYNLQFDFKYFLLEIVFNFSINYFLLNLTLHLIKFIKFFFIYI